MKAYKVKLMGNNNEYYIITPRQKEALEKMLENSKGFVKIGEDNIRVSAIKSINEYFVDIDGCPDYFIEQVRRENSGSFPTGLSKEAQELEKLPTAWIKLDQNGDIISFTADREMPEGQPYWYLAKCHFRTGKNGEREYIHKPMGKIAEAILMTEDPNHPGFECISRRYAYGVQKFPAQR